METIATSDLIEEFPDHNISRFIKMLEMHRLAKSIKVNSALKQKIHDERNFPITNLERFYNDKYVGEFLGISFNNVGKVKGKTKQQEFEKGFRKIVEDVSTGDIDSRKFNSYKERKVYVDQLPSIYRPDLSKTGTFESSDFEPIELTKKEDKPKKKRISKKMPKGLFIQGDVPFNLPSTSLKLMYIELRDINVAKFPNATHDLLRSFLECALVFYLKETKDYQEIVKNKKHNPKLSEMLGFIASKKCKTITDPNLIQVVNQIKSNWTENYSLERMNMLNHNENWNSTEQEVRGAWGKIEGLIKMLINPEI